MHHHLGALKAMPTEAELTAFILLRDGIIVLGLLAFAWVVRLYLRHKSTPRTFAEYSTEVHEHMRAILDATRLVAEKIAAYNALMRRVPAELRPEMERLLRVVQVEEQILHEQMIQAGTPMLGTVITDEVIAAATLRTTPAMVPATLPPPPPEEDIYEPNVVPFPDRDWINGQLIRRTAT